MKVIDGVRFKDLPTFYGAIIDGGELVGFGHFKSNGFWGGYGGGKKTTSYIRIEDGDEENPKAQFARVIKTTDDGQRLNFFFIETYDGSNFEAYIDGLKGDK